MKKIIKLSIILTMAIITIISINSYARNRARVFIAGNFPVQDLSDKIYAINGFNKLGYNVSQEHLFSKNSFLNWIRESSNNYAFYVSAHGEDGKIEDTIGNTIHHYELSGNWHLVYIDACESKASNKFPNALRINGYKSRAYLGWKTSVMSYYSNQFNKYFWNTYVTRYPIQKAAIYAANKVEGDGTTPIRFSGDTSWYGYSR